MPAITVYSQPNCQPCRAVTRKLDQLGATYVTVDVTEDPEALDDIRRLGYQQTPVIVVGEHHRSGYSPDWLKWAAEAAKS